MSTMCMQCDRWSIKPHHVPYIPYPQFRDTCPVYITEWIDVDMTNHDTFEFDGNGYDLMWFMYRAGRDKGHPFDTHLQVMFHLKDGRPGHTNRHHLYGDDIEYAIRGYDDMVTKYRQ